MTDKRTIDRRGSNHKQRTTYLLEDWLKYPAWSGGTQLGRGTLVHDSKSRERSTRAPRSWMTTAVVFLLHKSSVIDRLDRSTRGKFWSGGRGLARAPQVKECASASTFCAAHRRGQEASRPVQDSDLDSLRLRNPLQGYHWLGLVRQFCMASRSATRRFRAWHRCPERELLPFRPQLQHRRLDGKPPFQELLERDSRSGSRSSVHFSDDPLARAARATGGVDGPRAVFRVGRRANEVSRSN